MGPQGPKNKNEANFCVSLHCTLKNTDVVSCRRAKAKAIKSLQQARAKQNVETPEQNNNKTMLSPLAYITAQHICLVASKGGQNERLQAVPKTQEGSATRTTKATIPVNTPTAPATRRTVIPRNASTGPVMCVTAWRDPTR